MGELSFSANVGPLYGLIRMLIGRSAFAASDRLLCQSFLFLTLNMSARTVSSTIYG